MRHLINISNIKTRRVPGIGNLLGLMLLWAIVTGLFSCENNLEVPVTMGSPIDISVSESGVVLTQKSAAATAVKLSWTTGTNKGTGASISYILQIGKKGDNFAQPVVINLGKGVYAKAFTNSELNGILLDQFGVAPDVKVQLEARIIAVVSSADVEPDTSKVLDVEVTPFKPVSTTLYMIGDATPKGWDNTAATPLTADVNDPVTFTYEGKLTAGEIKFITTIGTWIPSYQKGTDNSHLFFRTDFSEPDDKFLISETGIYKISMNLVDLTISFAKLDQTPYNELWIVGEATPNGWNIDAPNQMVQDSSDPFVFTYNEILKTGEFKIPTSTGNWGTDYYMPLTDHPEISATSLQLVKGGSPDYKWNITEAGPYKIRLDLRSKTIAIGNFTPYTKLWMVGDATPAGWNITSPTEMVADPANPFVFTYEGALTAGEFKIPTATGDWGADFFMPVENHQDISITKMKFVKGGSPDNKWQITTAGNYKITIDQFYETILIEKQ